MSKHTPGPWEARRVNYQEWDIDRIGSVPLLGFAGWEGMATVYGCDDQPEEGALVAEANARLIAAAPDLLAACQAMAEWDAAENQLPPYDSDNGASFDQCMALCRDAFDKARAAIAKATGEQS